MLWTSLPIPRMKKIRKMIMKMMMAMVMMETKHSLSRLQAVSLSLG